MSSIVHVAIALVWRGESLLITRRPSGTHLAGFWEFPGGKLKPGEPPERAAEREVREEVAIECSARQKRPPIQFSYVERNVVLYPIDCIYRSGTAQALGVAEFRWIAPAELRNHEFPPANATLIAELLNPPIS